MRQAGFVSLLLHLLLHSPMYFATIVAMLAANPITVDAGVVVQIEVAVIGALGAAILRVLYFVLQRLSTIEATLDGPKGKGDAGLVSTVARIESDTETAAVLRVRTVAEYITWRRRVELGLKKLDPTFDVTPDRVLLDLLCAEAPE